MAKIARNAPCPCGSEKKFKHCCVREDEIGLLDPGPVPQHVIDETDKMMAEEGYTHKTALAFRRLTKKSRLRRRLRFPAMLNAFTGLYGGRH